jgi:hypothetical protein
MGYRLKFLVFLSVFLIGAFSIITWKAFRVYSESYAEAALQGEMEILEGRVQSIVSEFERFKSLASNKESIEARLKVLQLPLLAHVIFEEGKWKAQWYEGVKGTRENGKALATQISFESVPQSRNSWSVIRFPDRTSGYAFIIPSLTDKSVHFFSFFLDEKTIGNIMQKGSIVENLHIVAPQAGDIYNSSDKERTLIDGVVKKAGGQSQGMVLSSNGNKVVLFQFHPFLQAYVFKVIPKLRVASPPLSRFYGLIIFAVVLAGIAVFAMNLLFASLFERLNYAIAQIQETTAVDISSANSKDELSMIENLAIQLEAKSRELGAVVVPAPESAAGTAAVTANPVAVAISEALTEPIFKDDTTKALRSRVINCLGYLNRIKTQFQIESPHVALLEQELRDLRKIVDPATGIAGKAAGASFQPSFDPILANYKMDTDQQKPLKPENQETNVTHSQVTVRRPKRDINDFGDV